jgi:hypothetical protein
MENRLGVLVFLILLLLPINNARAADLDSDNDGLSDNQEINIFHTDPNNPDTDGDGWNDGEEVAAGYGPNDPSDKKLQKTIRVNLSTQELNYNLGDYILDSFKISSGDNKHPTLPGEYAVLEKKPLVTYKGAGYFFPNTKWNLMFKKGSWGNFYIHGAYWHNNFGKRVSHGCINVSYENMENLYKWADLDTKIQIVPK